jgi:hypothetical protein
MKPYFEITEDLLRPCTANELKIGATFYVKRDNGKFERGVIDLAYYVTPNMLQQFKDWVKTKSKEGKLFTRRDKAFNDFRDLY